MWHNTPCVQLQVHASHLLPRYWLYHWSYISKLSNSRQYKLFCNRWGHPAEPNERIGYFHSEICAQETPIIRHSLINWLRSSTWQNACLSTTLDVWSERMQETSSEHWANQSLKFYRIFSLTQSADIQANAKSQYWHKLSQHSAIRQILNAKHLFFQFNSLLWAQVHY